MNVLLYDVFLLVNRLFDLCGDYYLFDNSFVISGELSFSVIFGGVGCVSVLENSGTVTAWML